tara:strand:- start:16655 stop:17041 length:387 start_codon:yes stop_codon:yes gene_type:complete
MLDIGKFDKTILIQLAELGTDEMGGTQYDWSSGFSQWAFIEWKDGISENKNETTSSRVTVEFTIQNVSDAQQLVSANAYRIAYPINLGAVIPLKTQYYTITGIKLYGGREKYKTLVTHLATDTKPTAI